MQSRRTQRRWQGLSLVELIVVVGIIVLLVPIGILRLNPVKQAAKVRNTTRKNDTTRVAQALAAYSLDTASKSLPEGVPTCPATRDIGESTYGNGTQSLASFLTPVYLNEIPKDPKTGSVTTARYTVCKDMRQVTKVCAPDAELGEYICAGQARNGALLFNKNDVDNSGTDSVHKVYIDHTDKLSITGDLTLAAWIYRTRQGFDTIISKSYSEEYDLTTANLQDGDIMFYHGNAGWTWDSNIPRDTWTHVALVRDTTARTLRLYKNGTLVGSPITYTTNPVAPTASTGFDPVKIGNRHNYDSIVPFNGKIDDVRIYSRALSASEVQKLATDAENITSGLVGYWPFEEGSGGTTEDMSFNGHTGRFNVPSYSTGPEWSSRD